MDNTRKAMVDSYVLFLYRQQEDDDQILAKDVKQSLSNRPHKVDMTIEGINQWLNINGQPKMLLGEIGIEAMRELTKDDVW